MLFLSKICVADQFEFPVHDLFPGDILMIEDVCNWSAGCDHDTPNGFSNNKVQAIFFMHREGVTALLPWS